MNRLGKNLDIQEIKVFDIQRRVVAHMTQSAWQNIPHVSVIYEPDITEFYEIFQEYRQQRQKLTPNASKITFNTILLKMIAEGLKAAPDLNAVLDYDPSTKIGKVFISRKINIAIPWLLADGKDITPVIPDCGTKSLDELADYIADLQRRVQNSNINELLYEASFQETLSELKHLHIGVLWRIFAGVIGKYKVNHLKGEERKKYYQIPEKDRVSAKDLMDGSVLVSNLGSAYPQHRGTIGILEIIPPQVFVIGISSIQERPAVYLNEKGEKTIGIRKILPMALVFDHRWLDFAPLVPFEKRLDELWLNPKQIFK
jgi:pyruvate/2-oxoglutarate dehydrogenase complex dihydrolipoamide acyltransferase (E2) component